MTGFVARATVDVVGDDQPEPVTLPDVPEERASRTIVKTHVEPTSAGAVADESSIPPSTTDGNPDRLSDASPVDRRRVIQHDFHGTTEYRSELLNHTEATSFEVVMVGCLPSDAADLFLDVELTWVLGAGLTASLSPTVLDSLSAE